MKRSNPWDLWHSQPLCASLLAFVSVPCAWLLEDCCCICSSLLECQPSSSMAFSLFILIFDMWFDMNMVFYMWINLGAYIYSVIYKGILFTISYTNVNNFYLVVKLIPSHYDVQSVVLDILMLWYSFYLQPFLEFIFLSRNFQISDFSSLFWPLFAHAKVLVF